MKELIENWEMRMWQYRDEMDRPEINAIAKMKASSNFMMLRDCIKELKQQVNIPVDVGQSEQLLCEDCNKHKRTQGNGIIHKLCECGTIKTIKMEDIWIRKEEDYLTQDMIDKLQADVDDNNGVIDWSDLEPLLDGFKEQLLGVPKGT
ncbi:MAG: hypothetical protein GY739_17460, partial [Mesoflavibacter sp.]|nr:hypothetical protein [Mesoflavibacter sp.]